MEALEKAKNQRVNHIFDKDKGGFVWQANEDAIKEAQSNYDELVNQYSLEDRIAAWEAYRREWELTVESYQKNQDILITSEVLGASWENDILNQRRDHMADFTSTYNGYCDELNESVENSVASQIKNIEDLITQWSSAMDSITYDISQYQDILEALQVFEGANYEQRLILLQDFVAKSKAELAELKAAQESLLIAQSGTVTTVPRSSGSGGGSSYSGGGWSADSSDTPADTAQAIHERNTSHPSDTITVTVNKDGKAPKDLKAGDKVVTGGGTYEITKVKPDGTYESKKYAQGGVADYTGPAELHGSPSRPEVIFNSTDANKLYNMIHNTPDLIKSTFGNVIHQIKADMFKNVRGLTGVNSNILSPAIPTSSVINVSLGNITLPNVHNANDFARDVSMMLENQMTQRISKK